MSGSVGSPWSVRRRNCDILEHLDWLCRIEESTMQCVVHEQMLQNAEWWERGDNQGHDIMSLVAGTSERVRYKHVSCF